MHGDFHVLAVLQELGGVDNLLGNINLLVGLGVHEHMHVALLVEVGVGTTLHAHYVNLGTRGESVFQHAASLHVTHLGANESGTLARFHMEKLHDGVDVVVKIDAQSVFDISCCCHKIILVY